MSFQPWTESTQCWAVLQQNHTLLDRDGLSIDFFDIPMDGIQEANELDEYLGQAIEKVKDPIAWWWNHQKVYPQPLEMALVFQVSLNLFQFLLS